MIWRDIPNHSGYQVSDSYGVRSLDRTIEGRRGIVKGRDLATWLRSGRRVTKLSGIVYRVDALVESAFGGRVPRCSKGHSMAGALRWGTKNRRCADCAAGKPRVLELPEII